jgi:hypothetical protein
MGRAWNENKKGLETQAVAAHRAYVEALVAWERSIHRATCPICRPKGVSDAEQGRRCEVAEAEKERCRAAFRDLCDELGYVPTGYGVHMPPEDQSNFCQKCDN